MAFDGNPYPVGTLCYPYPSHPGAPVHDEPMASALSNAYFADRHNSRRIVQQAYPHNYSAAQLTNYVFQQTTWVRIAEGYARVPSLSTHLRASVGYWALPFAPAKVYHRIIATDGTLTATGNTFERGAVPHVTRQDVRNDRPFAELIEIEVSLSGIDLTQVCRAYVQAYCVSLKATDQTYSEAAPYRPQFINVYSEVRG